jgi:hypothetical protein
MSLTPLRKHRSIVDLAVGPPIYSTALFRSTERGALEVVGRDELGVAGVEAAHEASVPIKMSEDKTKRFFFMALLLSRRDKDSRFFFSIEEKGKTKANLLHFVPLRKEERKSASFIVPLLSPTHFSLIFLYPYFQRRTQGCPR